MHTRTIAADAVLKLGAKAEKYKGREDSTHNTAKTWEMTKAYLASHPKCTRKQLFDYLREERNHGCFVTYALSRDWLAVK